MVRKRDNFFPFRRSYGADRPRRFDKRPTRPPKPPTRMSWGKAWRDTRPFIFLMALVTMAIIANMPGAFEPPAFLQSEPERIAGTFTRCGPGRGYYCVIDGDTFRIGQRKVRVVGIDTAEVDALCPAEADQAEKSTAALQSWLNRGAFLMNARIDEPVDQYGRELRIVKRIEPDNSVSRLADWMQTSGGARGYIGDWRSGWC